MSWHHLLAALAEGFAVKFMASLDDTITKVPVISHITRTRLGKVAFSVGNLVALAIVIGVAALLSHLFADFKYFHYVAGGLIIVMAVITLLGLFPGAVPKKKKEDWPIDGSDISTKRFIILTTAGFTVSLATMIDDIAVMIPLYDGQLARSVAVSVGILAATILQLVLVIFFSSFLDRVPHKKIIAGVGLAAYGVLVITGIL